jgi:hypothetical protein
MRQKSQLGTTKPMAEMVVMRKKVTSEDELTTLGLVLRL